MRAISAFSRDAGMSTRVCLALTAFRIRVNMSEIGSVISFSSQLSASSSQLSALTINHPMAESCELEAVNCLPAALRHPCQVALEGELAEAQAAERELPHVRARTPAQTAAVAQPD